MFSSEFLCFAIEKSKSEHIELMQLYIDRINSGEDLDRIQRYVNSQIWEESEKRQLVLDYADYAWKYFDQLGTNFEREKKYHAFLKISNALLPEVKICSYFYDCYPRNILDLNGINLLLTYFQGKEKYKNRLRFSGGVDIQDLPALVQNLVYQGSRGETSFVVRQRGKKHVTPLFIRIDDKKLTAISLDALGGSESGYDWGSWIQAALKSSIKIPIEFYKFKKERQNDGISCAIFCIRDLLEHAKNNLFGYIEGIKGSDPAIIIPDPYFKKDSFLILGLPLEFMKVSQVEWVSKGVQVQKPENQRTSTDHKILHTRKKAYKYFKILLELILN